MLESIARMDGRKAAGDDPEREGIYPSASEYMESSEGKKKYQDTPAFIRYIQRLERRGNALAALPPAAKHKIDELVGQCKTNILNYAQNSGYGFTGEEALAAADFYQWYPENPEDFSLIFEAKGAAIVKRSLWHQYCHEELPKLNGWSIEDVCAALGVPVPQTKSVIPPDESPQDKDTREFADESTRKLDLKVKKLQLIGQRYKTLKPDRIAKLTAAMELYNLQQERDESLAGSASNNQSGSVFVETRYQQAARNRMKNLFKREMKAWAELFERHGFEFLTLFVDGFGGRVQGQLWGTNTGILYEQVELKCFHNGIKGFSDFVAGEEARRVRAYFSVMHKAGMLPDMWNQYQDKMEEKRKNSDAGPGVRRMKSTKRKRTTLHSTTTDSDEVAFHPAAGNIPAAEPDPQSNSHGTDASCSGPIDSQALAASNPDPSDTNSMRVGHLPLGPIGSMGEDPFQQPASTPNLFAPGVTGLATPRPSSPVSTNLFLNSHNTIVTQTALENGTRPVIGAIPPSSPPVPTSTSNIVSFSEPATPSRRARGISQSSPSTPLATPSLQSIAARRPPQTIEELLAPVKKTSVSAQRRQQRQDSLHHDILRIWNSAFPDDADITGFTSKAWAESKLAAANKRWVLPEKVSDLSQMYIKAKRAEIYKALKEAIEAGTLRIEDIV